MIIGISAKWFHRDCEEKNVNESFKQFTKWSARLIDESAWIKTFIQSSWISRKVM